MTTASFTSESAAAPGAETPVQVETAADRRVFEELSKLLIEGLGRLGARADTEFGSIAELLLRDALRERVSDVHLEPESEGARVRMRIDGALHDTALLTRAQCQRLVRHFKSLADLDPVALFKPIEARRTHQIDDQLIDLRLAFAPCLRGEKLTIRLLDPQKVKTRIGDLGMSEYHRQKVEDWLRDMNGMFLCAGKTGCGKTTTLYSVLQELKMADRSIVTIEDPVEYQVDGITQIQVDHYHGLSYADGLKAMLRMDPDYLMVGEIRDSESARAAAEASITGRVLLSTLHSRDAVGTITNLRSWGLADHEISTTLSVVIAQRLVRKLCVNCRQQGPVSSRARRWLEGMGLAVPPQAWLAIGCEQCHNLGYYGRTGVFEVWGLEEDDYDLISAHAEERKIRQHLTAKEHLTLLADGLSKATDGITTLEELISMGGYDPRFPVTTMQGLSATADKLPELPQPTH